MRESSELRTCPSSLAMKRMSRDQLMMSLATLCVLEVQYRAYASGCEGERRDSADTRAKVESGGEFPSGGGEAPSIPSSRLVLISVERQAEHLHHIASTSTQRTAWLCPICATSCVVIPVVSTAPR